MEGLGTLFTSLWFYNKGISHSDYKALNDCIISK